MAMVRITNLAGSPGSEPMLDKLKQALNGKTYMDFNVIACPVGGSFDVFVESAREDSEEELTGMVMMVMADIIMDGV